MRARRLVPLLLLVGVAGAALLLGGWGRERVITVTHGVATAVYVDNGATGSSVGDVRFFELPVQVKDSAMTGRLDAMFTTTGVNSPEVGAETRMAQLIVTFADPRDQLVVSGMAVYPAAGSTIVANSSTIRPITGGSGRYSGARGWCESVHLADGTWQHIFHLQQ
jgi:hypothetical protein